MQTVVDLLRSGRAGLVTDVDGTISPIVARPEDATVLPRARQALIGLSELLLVTAIVSGRRAADARAMVGIDGLVYVGNHGLERWSQERGAETVAEAQPAIRGLASLLAAVERDLPQPGIVIENKGASGSLHYRTTADPERARHELLALLARQELASSWRIEEGRMVINILPPLDITKGTAVLWLAAAYGLERLVYIGDDVTDEHAFRALRAVRDGGAAKTLSIAVIGTETPLGLRQLADATVSSAYEVADLLSGVLEQLRAGATIDRTASTDKRTRHA